MKFIRRLSIVLVALSLSTCDSRTPIQMEADHFERCKALIQTKLPDSSYLSLGERGKYVTEAARWDRCRGIVEDKFLSNEKKENNWEDTHEYSYRKLGGKVFGGSKEYLKWSGQHYFSLPYEWTHSYNYVDTDTYKRIFTSKQKTVFIFSIHSMNSLDIRGRVKQRANPINEACQHDSMMFIWNDMIFIPFLGFHNSTENLQKEWKTLCPIAVEAVKTQLTLVSDTSTNQ